MLWPPLQLRALYAHSYATGCMYCLNDVAIYRMCLIKYISLLICFVRKMLQAIDWV